MRRYARSAQLRTSAFCTAQITSIPAARLVLNPQTADTRGLKLIQQLRSRASGSRILVSANSESRELFMSAISAGVNGFLPESAEPEEIVQSIKSVHSGCPTLQPSMARDLLESLRPHDTSTAGKHAETMLTDSEQELVRLVADGCTDRQIADRIFASTRTVQNHLARVRRKTGMLTRAQIVRWAGDHLLL